MEIYNTGEFTTAQLEAFRKRYDDEIGCDLFEVDTNNGLHNVTCNFETRKEYSAIVNIENDVLLG